MFLYNWGPKLLALHRFRDVKPNYLDDLDFTDLENIAPPSNELNSSIIFFCIRNELRDHTPYLRISFRTEKKHPIIKSQCYQRYVAFF